MPKFSQITLFWAGFISLALLTSAMFAPQAATANAVPTRVPELTTTVTQAVQTHRIYLSVVSLQPISITGTVSIASGNCCIGGVVGQPLSIPVGFTAPAATQMRVRTASMCFDATSMAQASWETYMASKSYTYYPPVNWSSFYVSVQYQSQMGHLSPVYCDDISVEGLPPPPTSPTPTLPACPLLFGSNVPTCTLPPPASVTPCRLPMQVLAANIPLTTATAPPPNPCTSTPTLTPVPPCLPTATPVPSGTPPTSTQPPPNPCTPTPTLTPTATETPVICPSTATPTPWASATPTPALPTSTAVPIPTRQPQLTETPPPPPPGPCTPTATYTPAPPPTDTPVPPPTTTGTPPTPTPVVLPYTPTPVP